MKTRSIAALILALSILALPAAAARGKGDKKQKNDQLVPAPCKEWLRNVPVIVCWWGSVCWTTYTDVCVDPDTAEDYYSSELASAPAAVTVADDKVDPCYECLVGDPSWCTCCILGIGCGNNGDRMRPDIGKPAGNGRDPAPVYRPREGCAASRVA